jgi:hypothetical protein
MSGYIPGKWMPGNKVTVYINGEPVEKTVADYHFNSSPVHNSDYLFLKFTDGSWYSEDPERNSEIKMQP